MFLVVLAAALYSRHNLRASVSKDFLSAYQARRVAVNSNLAKQFQNYSNTLSGGAALFSIANVVSQADWAGYYQTYNLPNDYPAIIGLGYAPIVAEANVSSYQQAAYSAGQKNIKITLAGNRQTYAPITLLTNNFNSKTGKNLLGFDLLHNPASRQALEKSRASGQSVLYRSLNLPGLKKQSGLMIYRPVYTGDSKPITAQQRQAQLQGYSFMAINSKLALKRIVAGMNNNFGVLISQANQPAQSFLYRTADFSKLAKQPAAVMISQTHKLDQQNWQLRFVATPALLSTSERSGPQQELLLGIFAGLFFASLAWYLIGRRERYVAKTQRSTIQAAKDDLLLLASHQLRTPATIVKQYVGMLIEGYAGKLLPEQKAMLANAYESNERQLGVINQILYAAQLDAGRIKIHTSLVDLNKLLLGSIKAQSAMVAERQQKLTTKLPRKHIKLLADANYLAMVFENLLTNAIKYSLPDGTIALKASATDKAAIIEVSDSGIGIPANELKTIFDKFTRIKNPEASEVSGSGIGLYLAKEIVDLHGGSLSVRSRLQHGSTFRVYLPLKDRPKSGAAGQRRSR